MGWGQACRGHRPPPDRHSRLAGRGQDGRAAKQALIHPYTSESSGAVGQEIQVVGAAAPADMSCGGSQRGPRGAAREALALWGTPKLLTFPGCQSGSCLF